MFKRLMMVLVAVGLVVIFMTEAANAFVVRRVNTVENTHECNYYLPGSTTEKDPCFGADLVSDRLTGYDLTSASAICTMAGLLACESGGQLCTDFVTDVPLNATSFIADATFDLALKAQDLTSLDSGAYEGICGDATFTKFWPDVFLAYSKYTDKEYVDNDPFPNIDGNDDTYELYEVCTRPTDPGEDRYVCYTIWDSSGKDWGISRPHLPCCGVTTTDQNTLTVEIAPTGAGTVISDIGDIQCPNGNCVASFNNINSPNDQCPVVELTAEPFDDSLSSGYEFTEWIGCDPNPSDPLTCTVTPNSNTVVTANFEASYYTLKLVLENADSNDRGYIFDPFRKEFDIPETVFCYKDDSPCYVRFDPDTSVTIKKQGDDIIWGGACEGYNQVNSADTCTVTMDGYKEVIINFD